MSVATEFLPRYTYDDWVCWEGRWELMEGHPIAGNPLPPPIHARINVILQFLFAYPLKLKKISNCKVYPTIDYIISNDTILQPDMLIVCGEIEKQFLDYPPVLIAEIFTAASMLRDRTFKFDMYQQQGIKYYLMVDTDKETIELYELMNGKYSLCQHNYDESFTFYLEKDCTVEITLNELWDDN